MRHYIFKRVLGGMLTIILVLMFNFVLMRLAPGDPILTMMGSNQDNPIVRAELMARYGLDQTIPVQLMTFMNNFLLRGDMGVSINFNRPVSDMIGERIFPTILLGLTGVIIGAILGTAMGVFCARREGAISDILISAIQYVFNAFPAFWLGLILIIIFATNLGLFPSSGMSNMRVVHTGIGYAFDVIRHMVLPVATLVIVIMPSYFRIAKTAVLQVTNENFVTTFRATGMSESKIFRKYIFRNAILPTVTIFGISMAYLVTGVALIETVFAWPGMGHLVLTAIMQRDYPTILGVYIILSIAVAIVMMLVDFLYALLDPRIRLYS